MVPFKREEIFLAVRVSNWVMNPVVPNITRFSLTHCNSNENEVLWGPNADLMTQIAEFEVVLLFFKEIANIIVIILYVGI